MQAERAALLIDLFKIHQVRCDACGQIMWRMKTTLRYDFITQKASVTFS